MQASMSHKGTAFDNASLENVFNSPKNQLVRRTRVQTRRQAKASLFYSVEIVLKRQGHSSIGDRQPTPAPAEIEPETAA